METKKLVKFGISKHFVFVFESMRKWFVTAYPIIHGLTYPTLFMLLRSEPVCLPRESEYSESKAATKKSKSSDINSISLYTSDENTKFYDIIIQSPTDKNEV